MEITVAYYLKKKIFFLFRPSKEVSSVEEVLSLEPVILGGDISKVV